MAKTPDNSLPESWHKYFAIEANNSAWDLCETSDSVLANTHLLDAAHASAWHWRAVGTELNQMRSVMLLALVHARMNLSASAWAYAEDMKSYFLAQTDTPDWERSFTWVIHAWAAFSHGQKEAHQQSFQAAVTSLEAIQDPEDKEVVMKTFHLLPKP